jgi:hypothetical protein
MDCGALHDVMDSIVVFGLTPVSLFGVIGLYVKCWAPVQITSPDTDALETRGLLSKV